MASLTFYQNAVVGVQAEADVADFTLQSADKLYYHFDCADGNSAKWDEIFAGVQYQTIDNAQDEVTDADEGDGQGGTLHRYKHHSGFPDFHKDDLLSQVRRLVNFFMMNNVNVPAQGGLDEINGVAPIFFPTVDEVGESNQFLISGATWANMLLDQTGRITQNQLNLIIDHFGSKGRLKTASNNGTNALVQANLQKPLNNPLAAKTEIKLVITYEVRVIVTDEYNGGTDRRMEAGAAVTAHGLTGGTIDPAIGAGTAGNVVVPGDESAMFSSKTFAFTKGLDVNGKPPTAGDANDDASGAPKAGRVDCLRFRKTYCVESA